MHADFERRNTRVVAASIEGLDVGGRVSAGDITLPEGVELAADPEFVLAMVGAAPTAAEMEGEAAEAAPVGEAAEQPAESETVQA